jgi:hypothetical protein
MSISSWFVRPKARETVSATLALAMIQRNMLTSLVSHAAHRSLLVDFVTDDAADSCTAHGSDCTAARKDSTTNSSDTGADRCILILPRHPGTCTQTKQHCQSNCTHCESMHRFHDISSLMNIELLVLRTSLKIAYDLPKRFFA